MQKATNLNQNSNPNISTLSGTYYTPAYQLKKDVVLFVLRQSLLKTGNDAFEMVNRSLFQKYRCELSDCFEKPEYLSDVLNYVFDGSYRTIVESIKQNLDKFSKEGIIKEFLENF